MQMGISEPLDDCTTLGLATTLAKGLPSVCTTDVHNLFAAESSELAAGSWPHSSPSQPFRPFLARCLDEIRPLGSGNQAPRNFPIEGLHLCANETRLRSLILAFPLFATAVKKDVSGLAVVAEEG